MAIKNKKRILLMISCGLVLIILIGLFFASNYFFNFALASRDSSHQIIYLKGEKVPEKLMPVTTYKASRRQNEAWFDNKAKEKLTITSEDGLKLIGYFLPAKNKSNKLVILAHGFGRRAAEMGGFAYYYHNQGFNVFAPDDRAHGKSEGKYIGMGWLDRKDYLRWIDKLIKKLGPNTQILLHGRSMGGATVMMLGGEKLPKNVKCIIEDCGYTSVQAEFKYQLKDMFGLPSFPLIPLASLEAKLRAGYSFKDASALKQVKKCKIPMMFIHGGNDTYVPTKMVYTLYKAAKCKKDLWVVPKAAHAEAYFVDQKGYEKRIKNFYDKYLK